MKDLLPAWTGGFFIAEKQNKELSPACGGGTIYQGFPRHGRPLGHRLQGGPLPVRQHLPLCTTIIEYIRNTLKRVRKKESNLIMASQNLEDFDREGIRELTKPLFAIPPHQFIFNCGSIDKRFYMDLLQLEEAEYNLIRFPQRGVCLFKCGNERYLLEVHAPAYKEALFGTAGGR